MGPGACSSRKVRKTEGHLVRFPGILEMNELNRGFETPGPPLDTHLLSTRKIFSKLLDDKKLNFESVLLGRNWSQNRGNFGVSIEFSCQISLKGIKGF